jgi:vanillate O-demethylase monooxygenase subunit
MNFLRDTWYCCGFPQDLESGAPRALRILDEPVVLVRRPDGTVAALQDRCPHRFAPLSLGQVVDGALQCGYHGLRFDLKSGACIHNPHGNGVIPAAAKVKAYPVIERHGALWIWMGDPQRADPALLPSFSEVDERPGWARAQGYLRVDAHYELISDNLLDLSHAQYLHPFLFDNSVAPLPDFRFENRVEQTGDSVLHLYEARGVPMTPLFRMLWEGDDTPTHAVLRGNTRWYPPSLLSLDAGASPLDGALAGAPTLISTHWLTPETERSTHYFWAAARDTHVDDPNVQANIQHGLSDAFATEDEPMIEACQRNMASTDLLASSPLLLVTDGAAIRARRILAQRLRAQA